MSLVSGGEREQQEIEGLRLTELSLEEEFIFKAWGQMSVFVLLCNLAVFWASFTLAKEMNHSTLDYDVLSFIF